MANDKFCVIAFTLPLLSVTQYWGGPDCWRRNTPKWTLKSSARKALQIRFSANIVTFQDCSIQKIKLFKQLLAPLSLIGVAFMAFFWTIECLQTSGNLLHLCPCIVCLFLFLDHGGSLYNIKTWKLDLLESTVSILVFFLAFQDSSIREGFKKSKWKFKMAFAMKGGGVSRGSRVPHTYFEKWFLLKTI